MSAENASVRGSSAHISAMEQCMLLSIEANRLDSKPQLYSGDVLVHSSLFLISQFSSS